MFVSMTVHPMLKCWCMSKCGPYITRFVAYLLSTRVFHLSPCQDASASNASPATPRPSRRSAATQSIPRSPKGHSCSAGAYGHRSPISTSTAGQSTSSPVTEVVRTRVGMRPHWQGMSDDVPGDWMYPLSLFRTPGHIHRHRRWPANVSARDAVDSILNEVAVALEPSCVLQWKPRIGRNVAMTPPYHCFIYPPLSANAPDDRINPEVAFGLSRCMKLLCNEALGAPLGFRV